MIWNIFRGSPPPRQPDPPPPAAPPRPAPPPPPPRVSLPVELLQPFAGIGPNPTLQVLQQILEFMVKEKILTVKSLSETLPKVAAGAREEFIGHLLISAGALTEDKLLYTLSRLFRLPCYNISRYDINSQAITAIRGETARRLELFPVDRLGKILTVAVTNPFVNLTDLGLPADLQVRKVLCRRDELKTHLEIYYPPEPAPAAPPAPTPTPVPAPAPAAADPTPAAPPAPRRTAGKLESIFTKWSLLPEKDGTLAAIPIHPAELAFYLRLPAGKA